MLGSDAPSSPSPEDDLAELEKDEMLEQNTLALEAQFEERPLAKEQEKLQKTVEEAAEHGVNIGTNWSSYSHSAIRFDESQFASEHPEYVTRRLCVRSLQI